MSEREYFSYRYAIPGYTFILLVIAINYVPLLQILSITQVGQVFGAFLAFLSLFTGSAIGFLISQFWYLRFSRRGVFFGIPEFCSLERFLIEECRKYGLIEGTKPPLEAIWDYIGHRRKEDALSKYAGRRWDMYHVLSCAKDALAIGFVAGWCFRIYYELFVFNASFKIFSTGSRAELFAQLFITVSAIVLFFVIYFGRKILMRKYYPLLKAFIRHEFDQVGKELPSVFPNLFEPIHTQVESLKEQT